jgi:Tol biopolymer transport system component
MIAGRAAFGRSTISDTIAAVLERAPDWSALPGVTPAHVCHLLRRCLEKDPRQRLRDIGDFDETSTGTQAPVGQLPRSDRFLWPFAAASLAAIAFGMLAVRPQLTRPGGPPEFTRVTQIGGGQASEFGPAIAPDGKWIAYLSNARGATDVWVKFLSGGDPINLTATLPLAIQSRSDLGGLAIAPDGSEIAFDAGATRTTSPADFDAWVVPAPTGGTPRKVVERGRALRWSPDGTQMVFVRPGSSAGDALFVARADGGSARELVAVSGGMHIHWPVWSHDGRYIYFNYSISTANREPASIYRVSVAGGAVEPIVASARRAVFPLLTPDGAGLIYSGNPTSVDLALWWRPHGNLPPTRLTTGVGEYAEASMAADGRTMIATLVQFDRQLATISMASASVQPLIDSSAQDIDPVLSPAGDTLVFSSARSGFQNLWTVRSDGTMARALTSGNAFDERPAFSPDGRRLAFVSDRSGQRGIWMMSADGGIPEHLVDAPVIDRLLWSPDSSRIIYATTVGDVPGLHSVGVADGRVQRVATPGPALGAFSFSNDTIGYLEPLPGRTDQPNVNRIAFMRSTGEPIEADALKALNLANGFAVASPDGRRLAAIVEPGGAAGSVWVADLMQRTPFVKVTDFMGDARTRGGTWTSNNDALIVGLIQRRSHLVLFDQAK